LGIPYKVVEIMKLQGILDFGRIFIETNK